MISMSSRQKTHPKFMFGNCCIEIYYFSNSFHHSLFHLCNHLSFYVISLYSLFTYSTLHHSLRIHYVPSTGKERHSLFQWTEALTLSKKEAQTQSGNTELIRTRTKVPRVFRPLGLSSLWFREVVCQL